LVSVAIIDLPQWLDSVWDLAEKISGHPISVHNVGWLFWVTIPIGLVMLGTSVWAIIKTGKSITYETKQYSDISNRLRCILEDLHKRHLQLKDKAVIQYLSLFSLVDLLELCQEIGNSIDGYPSLYADMKKELGRKRLKKDKIKRRHQVNGVFDRLKPLLENEEWRLEKTVALGNELDSFPKIKNRNYEGIKTRREKDKRWKKLSNNLSKLQLDYPDIFTDKELEKKIVDYIDYSFSGSSICLFAELLNKYSSVDIQPSEYIESGVYFPAMTVDNRMTRLLTDIINKVESLSLNASETARS
jgi:hypothetical protein